MTFHLVVTRADEVLRPLGFRRRDATWIRPADGFTDIVDVQAAKHEDRITLNAGVLYPAAYIACWGEDPPKLLEEPHCTIRARIGELIDGRDVWWTPDEPSDVEIAAHIRTYLLPFLDRMHSVDEMVEFLTKQQVVRKRYPPPVIYLAALMCEKGHRAEARKLLDDLHQKTSSPWKGRIDLARQTLGC